MKMKVRQMKMVELQIQIPHPLWLKLWDLQQTGFWGATIEETTQRLIANILRETEETKSQDAKL